MYHSSCLPVFIIATSYDGSVFKFFSTKYLALGYERVSPFVEKFDALLGGMTESGKYFKQMAWNNEVLHVKETI
ncbi:hypothetical protein TSAR_003984 [Trichomalopsis sarcophagae]|uniref:Uncharacterized protein n=1 Tax=Trichomalopsis sarcophagae TaxID=543379 RepID=A0A232F7P3_9HYME|nr:hypothetical protein TSAR_003984 [Trichomalopsis sarcophagae]